MTDEGGNQDPHPVEPGATDKSALTAGREVFRFPALIAIALYMFWLAGFVIVDVVHGHRKPVLLIFSAAFIAASLGLLMLFRWAWNLTLAGVVLLMGFSMWKFTAQHDPASIVQGLLTLVVFLYLVRPELRASLR